MSIKEKKIDHKKALNFIAYGFASSDKEQLIDDWNLADTEQWEDDMDIYEEEEK